MKKITFLFLALWLSTICFGQLNIQGKVNYKENNEVLSGAHIRLLGNNSTDISNERGEFHLNNLKKGEYTLQVSYLGFATYEQKINLLENLKLDIQMVPNRIQASQVEVRATKASSNMPITYSNVGIKEINQNNLGKEIIYLLESTPSVITSSDAGTGIGYTNFRIRGVDATRINVSINGIPVNNAESHQTYLVNIPDLASSTNEIQVQRGVGTSTNGSAAFGGTVNFQTTTPQVLPSATFSSSVGSFNTFKNSLNFSTGLMNNWSVEGRLSQISSDGYIDRASARMQSYYLSAGYYGKKSLLKFVHFYGKEKTYAAWDGVPFDSLKTNRTYNAQGEYTDANGNTAYYDNQVDLYQQSHYQMFYTYNPNRRLTINAALHYTRGDGYYEQYKAGQKLKKYGFPAWLSDSLGKTDLIRQKHLANDFYGAIASITYNINKNAYVILGGGLNRYDGQHFGNIIWLQKNIGIENNTLWYDGTGVKTDGNIYAKLNYQVQKFNLYADLQFRHVDYKITGHPDDRTLPYTYDVHKKYPFFNPKAGVLYNINDQQKTYLSLGISNREPNRDNFTNASSPQNYPDPEKLYNAELGYLYQNTNFSAQANAFMMYYQDQLALTGEIDVSTGEALQRNVDQSYRTGLELSVNWQLIDNLSILGNATLSSNKILNYKDYVLSYDENYSPLGYQITDYKSTNLAMSPNFTFYARINYTFLRNFNISLDGRYISRQYIDNTTSVSRSLDPYFVNNAVLSYQCKLPFIQQLKLWVGVNNLFNVEYESGAWVSREIVGDVTNNYNGYFTQAGINVIGGLSITF